MEKSSSVFLQQFSLSASFKEERQQLFESLTMLLSSGTDLLSAIEVIQDEIKSPKAQKILKALEKEVGAGVKLSLALRNAKLISNQEFALLQIGEESGKISSSMDLIAKHEERERQFVSQIRSATLYPIIVLSIAVVVGIGIAWFILPRLASVFVSLHLKLPLATQLIVFVGEFLREYGIIAVPGFLIFFILLIYGIFFYRGTKHIGEWLLLHTPGIRRLIQESEVARFGYLFGTLLDAGIPIVNAIESVEGASTILAYKKFYRHLGEKILEGQPLGVCFRSYKKSGSLIPISAQHTIAASAESGRLSKTLIAIGERYEAKLELTTKNLGTLLEPIMIILIWLMVVFIAFAVISPIYGLLQGIR